MASKKILLLLKEDLPVLGRWCSWSSFGVPACWPFPGPCLGSCGFSVVGGFVSGLVVYISCVWVSTLVFVLPLPRVVDFIRLGSSQVWGRAVVLYLYIFCVWKNAHLRVKTGVSVYCPALALKPAPSLARILDDLEGQFGVDRMKKTVVNIMQQSAKSFVLYLATAEPVIELQAEGLKFRGHLLDMSPAKNTTTVVMERVPYGLPEEALIHVLSKYGEVKSIKPVTHKGYGLSRFKAEIVIKTDIPSRLHVQSNPVNVFYKAQPRSCFICQGAGHEAKLCSRKLASKQAGPVDGHAQQPNKRLHQSRAEETGDPPLPPVNVPASTGVLTYAQVALPSVPPADNQPMNPPAVVHYTH